MDDTVRRPPGRHTAVAGSLTVADLVARAQQPGHAPRRPADIARHGAPDPTPVRSVVHLVPTPRSSTEGGRLGACGPARCARGATGRSDEAPPPSTPLPTPPPAVPPSTTPPPTTSRRVVRGLFTGFGTLALLGLLATTAVSTAPPPARAVPVAALPPLTGLDALRPDLVTERLVNAPTQASRTLPQPLGDSVLGGARIPPSTAYRSPVGPPPVGVPGSDVDSVRDAIMALATDPASASTVSDVHVVDVAPAGGADVLATTLFTNAGGERYRTTLLITLTDDVAPLISRATLLSAQQIS